MRKKERQQLIRQLVREQVIDKQEVFVELLMAQGVEVTQATISRDIKELQLIKVSSEEGAFHYALPAQRSKGEGKKLTKMLQESVLSYHQMEKFLALQTIPGSAGALGILAETVYGKDLFTLVATDDKVLLIFKEAVNAAKLYQELNELIQG